MKGKAPERIHKLTPRGYNPAIVGITLWKFFHMLQKIEEEETISDYTEQAVSETTSPPSWNSDWLLSDKTL